MNTSHRTSPTCWLRAGNHDTPRRRTRGLLTAIGGVALSLVAGCGLGTPSPSVADLLDGRYANQERLAAIASITSWADQVAAPEGIDKVATQVYTACREGQNNYKVRDGYRVYCHAAARVYFSWSGTFDHARQRLESALGSGCSGPTGFRETATPMPLGETYGGTWECASGISVGLRYASLERFSIDHSMVSELCKSEMNKRCISVPPASEILTLVRGKEWLAVQTGSDEYIRIGA